MDTYAPSGGCCAADNQGCEKWGGIMKVVVSGRGAMGLEEFEEVGLVGFADPF